MKKFLSVLNSCYKTICSSGSVFVFALSFFLLSAVSLFGQDENKYVLKFKGGTYSPAPNIDSYINSKMNLPKIFLGEAYVVIQFTSLPDENSKKALRERGIVLLDYLTGNAYAAKISAFDQFTFLKSSGIRSIFVLEDRFKMDQGLLRDEIPAWAVMSTGTVDVNVVLFDWISPELLAEELQKINAFIITSKKQFRTITIRVSQDKLSELVRQPWLQWMETVSPPPQDDNLPGKNLHRSNVLNDGLRNLTGDSVKIGIWDGGTVGPHLDFTGRLVLAEPYLSTDHGTHVAGTMAGAGLLDPFARGMAPKARIYSHDYNGDINTEVASAISTYGITMTQNSWGYGDGFVNCTNKDPYNTSSREQDINVQNNPTLVHCHSSGNSQSICTSGWGTTTGKAAKNILVVANVTSSDVLSASSSCGPVADGRLKPEICGMGTNVYSTLPYDTYTGGYSGTSMATPGVTGTIAQLVQRYRQLNGYNSPPASLMKAIACNTAKDLGNPGPDYRFGFGRINGVQAVRALENNRYRIDSLSNGASNSFSISVPANVKRLKVLISWTDPAGAANSNPALVNDLDLTLTDPASTSWNPWVLDAALPGNNAIRLVDHLNNIEQVTLDDPSGGIYTLNVTGYSVPVGAKQVYSITWEIESAYIEITYPNGREIFAPTSTEVIYWDHLGLTGNQTLQYSLNNGSTWTTISSSISSSTYQYSWIVPSVVTSQALIRITSGALSDVGDSLFSILGSPLNLALNPGCVSGQISVSWNSVANATHYDVMQLDQLAGVWNVAGANLSGTQYFVSGLTPGNTYWFSVRARNNTISVVGKNAVAKSILVQSTLGTPPSILADGPLQACPGSPLLLSGANVVPNTYLVSAIPFQTYTPGADIVVTLTDDDVTAALPVGFTFNFFGNSYSQFYIGSNGLIGFNSAALGGTYTPQLIPDATTPNNLIAFAWTDLNPAAGGTITYLTTGVAPNRKLIVSYNNVNRYGSTAVVSGRIELNEGTDIIEIFTSTVSAGTNTMGIENANGSVGIAVSGRNKTSWSVASPEGIRFVPHNSTIVWQPGAVNASTLPVSGAGNFSFSYSLNGCTLYSDTVAVTSCASDVSINIKAFIQGFYRAGGRLVENLSAGNCDTLILNLANDTEPFNILYSDTAIFDTAGNAEFIFPPAIFSNLYYLVLEHRNSLETWSASSVFMNSTTISYDFTMNAGSAYGNNLCDMGDGRFAVWSGDIDRNGLVDFADLTQLQNYIGQYIFSYHIADLNGDNHVESADFSLIENNLNNNLQVAKP